MAHSTNSFTINVAPGLKEFMLFDKLAMIDFKPDAQYNLEPANSDILVDAIDRNSKHYAYNSSSIEHSKLTMRRGDGSLENIIFELGTFARLGSISRAFKKLEALTFIALIFLLLKHLRRVSSSGLKDLHSIGTFTESVHLARHQKKPQDNLQFSRHQFPMEIVE